MKKEEGKEEVKGERAMKEEREKVTQRSVVRERPKERQAEVLWSREDSGGGIQLRWAPEAVLGSARAQRCSLPPPALRGAESGVRGEVLSKCSRFWQVPSFCPLHPLPARIAGPGPVLSNVLCRSDSLQGV